VARTPYSYIASRRCIRCSKHRKHATAVRAFDSVLYVLGWPRGAASLVHRQRPRPIRRSAKTARAFQRRVGEVRRARPALVMGLEDLPLWRATQRGLAPPARDLCLERHLDLGRGRYLRPAHFNDRLLLGLKGTMSEAGCTCCALGCSAATWPNARRGELQLGCR